MFLQRDWVQLCSICKRDISEGLCSCRVNGVTVDIMIDGVINISYSGSLSAIRSNKRTERYSVPAVYAYFRSFEPDGYAHGMKHPRTLHHHSKCEPWNASVMVFQSRLTRAVPVKCLEVFPLPRPFADAQSVIH